MILLDPDIAPDLDPARATKSPPSAKLPSARTLARFLTQAQTAVRLRGQVTVLLTTDRAIRKLNRQFRAIDKATDVLSFPAQGIGAEKMAGDLAISVPTARRQAADQNHALATELKVLILHGLLHLAGHDHEADNGQMARRERQLRTRLRLPQGLIERAISKINLTNSKIIRPANKAVILSESPKRRVEGPASRAFNPARTPSAPSIPRLHPEWVGNHKSRSGKATPLIQKVSPTAGGRP